MRTGSNRFVPFTKPPSTMARTPVDVPQNGAA